MDFYVAGRPARGAEELVVRHPYDGREVGRTSYALPEQVEEAVAAAAAVAPEAAALPAAARAAALDHVSRRLAERADEVARLITAENGKPLKWARIEAARAVSTFRWAAEEARRFSGELQRLDTDPTAAGRMAVVRRFPRGPVLGISPFNFPLNLVAHKVAPALAVGAPIVLKPAPATPLSALLLGEILAETDLPPGMFSILPVPNDRAAALVEDPRLPVVSFTGSGPVGAIIQRAVPHKRVTLELGGNGAAVICADWSADEDLTFAAERIATFANYQAGQSCVAVQRVYVHEWLYDGFLPRLVAAVSALRTGDPTDEDTDVGPLINEDAARRVEEWVDEAVGLGGALEVGGKRDGTTYPPTVLTGVPAAGQGLPRGGLRPGHGRRAGHRRRGRLRGGQRLGVRPAGGRVHARPADRVHRAPDARGGRRHRGRRAVVPGRPDAVRRCEGLRGRAGGPAQRDGGLHRPAGHGPDRHRPLIDSSRHPTACWLTFFVSTARRARAHRLPGCQRAAATAATLLVVVQAS